MEAIYRVSGQHVETSASAAGPWRAEMQHGAAPAALVAWAADGCTDASGAALARSVPSSADWTAINPLRDRAHGPKDPARDRRSAVERRSRQGRRPSRAIIRCTHLKRHWPAAPRSATAPGELRHPTRAPRALSISRRRFGEACFRPRTRSRSRCDVVSRQSTRRRWRAGQRRHARGHRRTSATASPRRSICGNGRLSMATPRCTSLANR
jgi:hypothetical protein